MKVVDDDPIYGRCLVCGQAWHLLSAEANGAQPCRCGAPSGAVAPIRGRPTGRIGFLSIDTTAPPLPNAEVDALRAARAERQFLRQARIDGSILDEYRDAPPGIGMWPPKDEDEYRRRGYHAANAWPLIGQHLFHVPTGWVPLVERACVEIALLGEAADDAKTAQIKEKFGVMTWYLDRSTRAVEDIVDEAEDRSAATCACCGGGADAGTRLRGRDDGRYWALTLCDGCHALLNSDLMRRMYPDG